MHHSLFLGLLLLLGAVGPARGQVASGPASLAPIDCVDPFIGTLGEGNVYPGATVPFGFIQASPDTGPGSGAAGYKLNRAITGFSQQHLSGMGGPLYGEVSLLPLTGPLAAPAHLAAAGKSAETASPGYYGVTLAPWNTRAELTATRHVALHRYTFPAHEQAHIVVDVGACLYGTGADWNSAQPIGGEVHVDAAAREVSGYMLFQGARDERPLRLMRTWKVYFAARFDTPPASFGTWNDQGTLAEDVAAGTGREIGACLNFRTRAGQVINAQVAVSFRSVAQARGYFAEVLAFDFEPAHQGARAAWRTVLDNIQVEGGSADQRRQFYTALYRVHLTPNDWTGEAPERYGDGPYFENILCLWDTFRTVNPLLTLIQPQVQANVVNTLLAYYQHDGWTGDAHSAWTYEHVQNGSNADVVIADAYAKKLPGIDWKRAYAAIRKNAFVDQDTAEQARPHMGRYRLAAYRRYHYLPTDIAAYKPQSVSRTLEYVYDDACVLVLALARTYGTAAEVADLEARQLWYRNAWDAQTGFMRGRNRDGSWVTPFDPAAHEEHPGGRRYYEGHAWTWSWYVPHDAQGLINLVGGPPAFVDKLSVAVEHYYQAFNEPCMLETYLFTHAGRPDKTQFYARKALANFSARADGLPGNDDSGTTSAWLVWAMLGLYPNAGQDFYYLGSPTFTKATIRLGNGKLVVIKAPASSATAQYVGSATLDGWTWNQAWFRHRDIANGATLTLGMSPQPSGWGNSLPPPSLSARPQADKAVFQDLRRFLAEKRRHVGSLFFAVWF
ncbi:GH92 family glycosyl hydrolase [Hymenobacter terricola]|uniref:GH92 family glycosyl hydrolase n=1 Tax=Hymenobacter terricola TaxID=2819236 RepID=UPI001B303BF7|nr:GH92 family glycosyl hydrolase [Hymenobacter terricola]